MKLIPVTYYGFTAMDRRFSSPMLPWIVSEIRKRDYCEKLSLGIEDGVLQAYNPDFELQFSHKIWQVTRFSQADQDPTTFLYLMRDDQDSLLYCYLFQAKKSSDVLHVIDRVLDPMTHMANPSAFDFLQHYNQWDLGPLKSFNFWTRVQYHDKSELYQKPGGHTFFIPVDDKMDDYRLQSIDSYVIEAHVIPNMVLFTRPTAKNFIFESASNGDYIYIVLSMTSRNDRYYIKSFTVLGDSDHKRGEVFAEIIKSDIPVTNGVVHLISKPLAVFDRQLQFFPYLPVIHKVTSDPNLDFTYNLGSKNRINKILKQERGMYTYFAPKNRAWRNYTGYSHNELVDILTRHLIVAEVRYTMPKLVALSKSTNGSTILETLGGTLKLQIDYFDDYYHLKWGTKWVRVSRPDYKCTNGVVHIVDDVFATPKLAKPNQTPKSGFWRTLKDTFT